MKRIFRILFCAFLVAIVVTNCKPKPEDELPGGIYGTVTDKATGEPISVAGVELHPGGQKTVTGSEGQYEFTNVEGGEYTLAVTKTGYIELDNIKVTVKPGQKTQSAIQIEKLPLSLRVVDGNGNDISSLDFGVEEDVTSRTFSIFNDGVATLTWWIEENCPWISDVKSMISNKQSGKLEAGKQEPIKVTIDRTLAGDGLKSYILNINSDNGSKELTISVGEAMGLPLLQTNPVSNLSSTSVTCNGTITNPGTPAYTERGFVYGSTAQPTIEENMGKLTAVVNENADFSVQLTGLSSNCTYYVRSYAINTVGIAYGNDVNFTTGAVNTEVSTSAVTEINTTSARLNATIIVEGEPAYTECGFCYATKDLPTISDNKKVVEKTGTGVYSVIISDLDYKTTYYVRAYAIQNGQPIYGNEVEFKTVWDATEVLTHDATNVAATSATLLGTIVYEGNPPYTERGFCYSSTTYKPSITDSKVIVPGVGIGEFSFNLSNLENDEMYTYCSYAIQNGTVIYGNYSVFTTVYSRAEVIVNDPTIIGYGSLRLKGSVLSIGEPNISERGFCYQKKTSSSTFPNIHDNKIVVPNAEAGDFYADITDLEDNETYAISAYVIQNGVPAYSGYPATIVKMPEAPIVITGQATIKETSTVNWTAVLQGAFLDGNPSVDEWGFVYGTSDNPTVETAAKVTIPNLTQKEDAYVFKETLSFPAYQERYYYSAFVKTVYGYIYGNVIQILK